MLIIFPTSPSTKLTTKEIGQTEKVCMRGWQTFCKGADSKNIMLCGWYSLCHKYSTLRCSMKTAIDNM